MTTKELTIHFSLDDNLFLECTASVTRDGGTRDEPPYVAVDGDVHVTITDLDGLSIELTKSQSKAILDMYFDHIEEMLIDSFELDN